MSTLRAYGHALRNPTLVVSGIQFALGLSILYGTVALLPFLALHRLHMTAATYGSVFFISYLGYFVGALFCIATAGRLEATRAMLIGICVTLIGGLAFGALALTHSLSIPGVFSCVFVIFLGLPIVFSNASALGVVKHDDKAIGSAVYAFIYGFGACVSLAVAGSIHGAYDLVLPAWTVGLMLIALTLYFAFTTRERRGRAPRSSGTII